MSAYEVLMTAEQIEENEGTWLNERAADNRIGASESAAILGLSPWSTPLDVWEAKQPGHEPIQETRFMTWGKRLEASVAEGAAIDFRDRLGVVRPSPGLLASTEIPWLLATPDRENAFGTFALDLTTPTTAVTEIKTGSAFARSNWFGENGEEIIPPYYEVQVQQQMKVRGVRRGFVVVLIGGNELLIREVDYSPSFIDLLVDELDEWRNRYLLGDETPPATAKDLHRFTGKAKGEPDSQIVASERVLELVQQRNVVQPAQSALKKQDDEVKDEIRAFMGEQTELVDADGKLLVTWYRSPDKTGFDLPAFKVAHPAIYEEFVVDKPGNRTMLFKSKDTGLYLPIATDLRIESLSPEGVPAEVMD